MFHHSPAFLGALRALGLTSCGATDELSTADQIVLYARISTPLGLYDTTVTLPSVDGTDPRCPGAYEMAALRVVEGLSAWIDLQR